MAFFNYSRMQLAAKIVYYGPGLCGKTTNLQYIYKATADNSRGEMVSLETATDRTLFFDLLPIEVGSIAGFKTRIRVPIDLEELYVPLRAIIDLRATGDATFPDAEEAEKRLRHAEAGREIPLAEAFRETQRRKRRGIVVLGDPGSGQRQVSL